MQSDYLCIILHVKHKKIVFIAVLPDFYFLVNFKMATIFGEVTGLQQHYP